MNKEQYDQTKEAKEKQEEYKQIEAARQDMAYNFKLWLCESFVRINEWELLEEIIGGFYEYRLDLTLHKPLLTALLEALEWFIDPLFMPMSKEKLLTHKNATSIENPFFNDEQDDHSLK